MLLHLSNYKGYLAEGTGAGVSFLIHAPAWMLNPMLQREHSIPESSLTASIQLERAKKIVPLTFSLSQH
jgi:hypothetical protein